MTPPLVSIIIPVFNTEAYLPKCVESVIKQTYINLEILIINDCSPDSSEEIVKKYQAIDKRIKYIKNGVNLGLGETRNVGLAIAEGKYIQFLDSDDFLDQNTIDIVVNVAEEYNVDLVEYKFKYFHESYNQRGKSDNTNVLITKILTRDNSGFYASLCEDIDSIVCNKLFKKRIIDQCNLRFTLRVFEDSPFTLEYLLNADKIVFIDNYLYNYVIRKSSITNAIKFDQYLEAFITTNAVLFFIIQNYSLINELGDKHIMRYRNELAELLFKANINQLKFIYEKIGKTIKHSSERIFYQFEQKAIGRIIHHPIYRWFYIFIFANKNKFIRRRIKSILAK